MTINFAMRRLRVGTLLILFTAHALTAGKTLHEDVSGPVVTAEWSSSGINPHIGAAYLFGRYSFVSGQLRGAFAVRPADGATISRLGYGFGVAYYILHMDFTVSTGPLTTTGLWLGTSAPMGREAMSPELRLGYQINFDSNAENVLNVGVGLVFNTH